MPKLKYLPIAFMVFMCSCTCTSKEESPEFVFTGTGGEAIDSIFTVSIQRTTQGRQDTVFDGNLEIVSTYHSSLVVPEFDLITLNIGVPSGDSNVTATFARSDWDGSSRVWVKVITERVRMPSEADINREFGIESPSNDQDTEELYDLIITKIEMQLVDDDWSVF